MSGRNVGKTRARVVGCQSSVCRVQYAQDGADVGFGIISVSFSLKRRVVVETCVDWRGVIVTYSGVGAGVGRLYGGLLSVSHQG